MNDEILSKIAIFFYCTLLNEKWIEKALPLALQLWDKEHETDLGLNETAMIVYVTNRVFKKHLKKVDRFQIDVGHNRGWEIPGNIDLGTWKAYQKFPDQEQLHCVVWNRILGISEKDISQGLDLSFGTIRYRIGKGLHQLGTLLEPGARKFYEL